MRVWSSLPPERFILKAYVGWLDEDYEAANTLQPNCIFNLRGLSPTSYTRRALLESGEDQQFVRLGSA
jgi:hypothetical protein